MKTSATLRQDSLTSGDWLARFRHLNCALDTLACLRRRDTFAHRPRGHDPFQTILSLARMEVEQRFPRMQLVRKAAEQYQRLIMDCTRPTLAIHQQQQKMQLAAREMNSRRLRGVKSGFLPVLQFKFIWSTVWPKINKYNLYYKQTRMSRPIVFFCIVVNEQRKVRDRWAFTCKRSDGERRVYDWHTANLMSYYLAVTVSSSKSGRRQQFSCGGDKIRENGTSTCGPQFRWAYLKKKKKNDYFYFPDELRVSYGIV
ncbi:hypothetical protein OUZ56_003946 [Daphnia magna]|uniref:Uncharacterized protein n=1 Tax=Daphnia magna TaxID=35525 RepID=A0ABQ9YNN6_9CRUS|nr:hypothetical protein OUZ56_003946 [Daphnia magna]